jgi:hypothetical protein
MVASLGLALALIALPDSLVYNGQNGDLDVGVPRFQVARVDIDGRLDEPRWLEAAVLDGFTQYEPVEGGEASEATELKVFYTEEAIYFGIRAYDSEPDRIIARLGERDRGVFGDDWVRITLDTFEDQRQAYVFYVNPLGLQTDGLWVEGLSRGGVSIDYNPDYIWESDGQLDDEGWTAEIRVPFVSLRFREVPSQNWGIQVAREVKRRGFKQSWAPLTKDISNTLAQSGRLVGLRDLHPRRLVEVNPVTTAVQTGSELAGEFQREDPRADFGLNARIGVTQNLVLDGTYNPDFSQVEADANRLSINERFALYFPEKRTFFLEGTDIFNTPANLVYTRRIVDPVAGTKLTGKVGSFAVGYIGALDESPSSLGDASGSAAFNLVRTRADVGTASTVGILYADRTMTDGSGAYNRVFAGDARLVFRGRYTFTTQVAGSLTRAPDAPGHLGLEPLFTTNLSRGGRTFSWGVGLTDIADGFSAQSGFITRAGDTKLDANMSFTRFGRPGAALESTSLRITSEAFFTHEGFWAGSGPFEQEIQLWPTLSFRGGRTLTFILRNGHFRFQPQRYDAYAVQGPDGSVEAFQLPPQLRNLKAIGLMPRLRITNSTNLNGMMFFREVPIFAEASRGLEMQIGPDVQLKPTAGLQLSLKHTFSRIWRRGSSPSRSGQLDAGAPYSTVNLSRLRIQYQFNRAVFVRGVVQYDFEQRAPLRDPTTGYPLTYYGSVMGSRDNGEFQGQFLVQYQPSPGTIFYVGYTRMMQGERTFRIGQMRPMEDGLFLKLSYLFRM